MPNPELVLIDLSDCPKCHLIVSNPSCVYQCVYCEMTFCSRCYLTDHQGPGTYVFCPFCGCKLHFPRSKIA